MPYLHLESAYCEPIWTVWRCFTFIPVWKDTRDTLSWTPLQVRIEGHRSPSQIPEAGRLQRNHGSADSEFSNIIAIANRYQKLFKMHYPHPQKKQNSIKISSMIPLKVSFEKKI